MALKPRLALADKQGRIFDHPTLLLAGSRGGEPVLPGDGELVPLPAESELFLLPERVPVGYNPVSHEFEETGGQAVAAFTAPGFTLSAHPLYREGSNAPVLPLFAYGAVGYARGRFWIWASRTDYDRRQKFGKIREGQISSAARALLEKWPKNRLVAHIINNCVFRYGCPAAKNFALGRYEAPLPTSRSCNARCIGCISQIQPLSPVPVTPQCRLDFVPDAHEIAETMSIHERREREKPIYSFGQGCEGDPLMNVELLANSIRLFRNMPGGGKGTINCNTNASRPEAVELLAKAGLTSMRVSLNSARPDIYHAYYNPEGYAFANVEESARIAAKHGVFVSLNLLWFPGLTDMPAELDALAAFCRRNGVSMIQWRNLNIDPVWYMNHMRGLCGPASNPANRPMGLNRFRARLQELCPWLTHGYFNPYLGEKAQCPSPLRD